MLGSSQGGWSDVSLCNDVNDCRCGGGGYAHHMPASTGDEHKLESAVCRSCVADGLRVVLLC